MYLLIDPKRRTQCYAGNRKPVVIVVIVKIAVRGKRRVEVNCHSIYHARTLHRIEQSHFMI